MIATGARPSINLAGPFQVDAWGVQAQVQACRSLGLKRVLLVSSLCAGRWLHPLNLFGLILVWKRLGERCLERSGLGLDGDSAWRPERRRQPKHHGGRAGDRRGSTAERQHPSPPCGAGVPGCSGAAALPVVAFWKSPVLANTAQTASKPSGWIRTELIQRLIEFAVGCDQLQRPWLRSQLDSFKPLAVQGVDRW